jgi:hypothetical protein
MSEASRNLRTMSSFQDTPPEIAYLDPSQPESTQDDPGYRRRITASTRLRANGVCWPDARRVALLCLLALPPAPEAEPPEELPSGNEQWLL